jgi:hypothetical protein
MRLYDKKYRTECREEYLIYKRKYYKEHKDKWNEYVLNRRKSDLPFKILMNLRHRINMALVHNFKSEHTKKLLGCSIEFLKNWLTIQFTEGMSWKNYGKWEIDHIRPCASFDLSIIEHQNACFNYLNLQPLWAEENRSKGSKIKEII